MTLHMIFDTVKKQFCRRTGGTVPLKNDKPYGREKPYIWNSAGPAKSAIWRWIGGKPVPHHEGYKEKMEKAERYRVIEVHIDDLLEMTLWKNRIIEAWEKLA